MRCEKFGIERVVTVWKYRYIAAEHETRILIAESAIAPGKEATFSNCDVRKARASTRDRATPRVRAEELVRQGPPAAEGERSTGRREEALFAHLNAYPPYGKMAASCHSATKCGLL